MAQRYGRSRRRAHMEKIEQLEKATIGLKSDLRSSANDIMASYAKLTRYEQMMASWDRDVRAMLGPYSAFLFKRANIAVDRFEDIKQVAIRAQLNTLESMPDACLEHAMAMRVASLIHCIYSINDDRKLSGELQTQIRLRMSDGHGCYAVAFSERYLEEMAWRSERDIHELALRIANDMLARINPKRARQGPV